MTLITGEQFGDEFAAWSIELIGLAIPSGEPAAGPLLQVGDGTVQVWLRRARRIGWSGWVEVRWNPGDGEAVAKSALLTDEDRAYAKQGLRLLQRAVKPGRPRGTSKIAEALYRERRTEIHAEYVDLYGRTATQTELAAGLSVDARTIRRYERKWPE